MTRQRGGARGGPGRDQPFRQREVRSGRGGRGEGGRSDARHRGGRRGPPGVGPSPLQRMRRPTPRRGRWRHATRILELCSDRASPPIGSPVSSSREARAGRCRRAHASVSGSSSGRGRHQPRRSGARTGRCPQSHPSRTSAVPAAARCARSARIAEDLRARSVGDHDDR